MLKPSRSEGKQFVLKNIPEAIFSNFNNLIRPHLSESNFIRLPCDEIPDQRIFVYRYLTDDLLSLIRKNIPVNTRKQILRTALRGIAELHSRDVVNLGKYTLTYYHYTNNCSRRETGQHFDRHPPRRSRLQDWNRSDHRYIKQRISSERPMHQRNVTRKR